MRISLAGHGHIEQRLDKDGKPRRDRDGNYVYRFKAREPGTKRFLPSKTVHCRSSKKDSPEVKAKLQEYLKEQEERLNDPGAGKTVAEYAREFHNKWKLNPNLSPLTVARDEHEIKLIEELFAVTPVSKLEVGEINEVIAALRSGSLPNGNKQLSENAIYKVFRKLSRIMREAVKEGLAERNPCDLVDNVTRPEIENEREGLPIEKAIQLARDLKSEQPRNGCIVAVWIALATGMRRGEILGLLWDDVDLGKGVIRVRKQLDSKGERRRTKSKTSRRTLAIDAGTVTFLREWREQQREEFGDAPSSMFVCTNRKGSHLEPNFFGKWRRCYFAAHGLGEFKRIESWVDAKGVKRTRRSGYVGYNLHELRHTQATLMIGSGEDIKTVQHRLGHSSAQLTMNTYAHAIEENDRKAADSFGASILDA